MESLQSVSVRTDVPRVVNPEPVYYIHIPNTTFMADSVAGPKNKKRISFTPSRHATLAYLIITFVAAAGSESKGLQHRK